jgi:hypothetical protein
MNPELIEQYIMEHFCDIVPQNVWGERAFFINPDHKLKRGSYFSTIKDVDGPNDKASKLSREGVFRLNIGVSKDLYKSLFSEIPKRPALSAVIEGDYDFEEEDVVLPHPVYGWIGWISILNPTQETFEKCIPCLKNAYDKAQKLTNKKLRAFMK